VASDLTKRNIQTPTVAGSFDPKLRFAKNPRINGGDSVTRPAGFVKDLEQVKTFDKNLNDYLTVATKIDSDEKAMKAIIDNAENAAGEELDGANFMKDYMVAMSQIEKADADCNKKLMAFVEASKNTELNKSMLDSGANAFQGCPEADRIRTSALAEQDAIKAKADGIIKNYTSPADRKILADIDRRMPAQRTKMLQAQSILHTSYIDYLSALSRILGVPVPPLLPLSAPPNPDPH
jgi:hypothetical protein